jgi:oligoribonuclease NrnB/cAMP/cGMP phosphodiesterase (DHH superfamily)
MHENPKEIVVLYHGGCPDGLGGAYAAWKKFGDTAEYIPAKHGKPLPEGLEGRKLYFIDFSYPQEIMDGVVKTATSVTVLDHHLGTKEIVESMPDFIFDEKRSGATIAWGYFHPDTPVPALLRYIEDGDLYKFALPDSRSILAYLYTSPLLNASFEHWDSVITEMEDPTELARIIATGALFEQYHEHVVANGVRHAELVTFEGYECYLASSSGEFVSDIGNKLVTVRPPIAIIVSASATDLRVSLRSDKTIDVAAIARKYGGNGHPAAAGFRIPLGERVPWLPLEEHENPRD